MIAFDLQCMKGHTFEGWFEDSHAYEDQKKRNLIACPMCNTTAVSKILSPVAIKRVSRPPVLKENKQVTDSQLAELSEKIVDYVNANFDDVGCDFSKEALKMHYGVSEPRNIRGVSTPEEEKTLQKEGVSVFKFPMPVVQDSDSDTDTDSDSDS
jgi:hypothetical protein